MVGGSGRGFDGDLVDHRGEIPLAATALVPFVLFPALDVVSVDEVGAAYANPVIFLFLDGFLLALAVQRWDLHRRVALLTEAVVGARPRRMVLGFMLASGGLSIWISNTATAMMMLPIALSVAARGEGNQGFPAALMLATAYGASIGGVATLIGTPPNAILARMLADLYGLRVGFAQWMAFGLPLSAVMMVVSWWYLTRFHFRNAMGGNLGSHAVARDLAALGSVTVPERRVAAVFLLVAALWVGRGLLPLDTLARVSDAGIAIAGAIALFVLPAGRDGQRLLDWADTHELPWDVLILSGGWFALGVCAVEKFLLRKRHSGPFSRSFSLHSAHYAPQKNDKMSSLCHFLATKPSTAQTPSRGISGYRSFGMDRPATGSHRRQSALGCRRGDSDRSAAAYRADFQYRHCGAADPHHCRCCRWGGSAGAGADDRCCDCSFLCLHAAGGHPAQCSGVRQSVRGFSDMVRAGLVLNLAGVIVITAMVSWWLPWVWPAAAGG